MSNFLRVIIALSFLFLANPSFAFFDQIRDAVGSLMGKRESIIDLAVNPLGRLNPTGIPTTNDLTAYVLKNPDVIFKTIENPTNAGYIIVANSIISSRNAVIANGGMPIPDRVKAALKGIYSDELMNSVRWSTNWNLVQNTLQAVQMFANKDTGAIALMDTIVFRESSGVDNALLWVHELHHIQQYRDWGVEKFAENWVNNSSINGPVEAPAYEHARAIEEAWDQSKIPTFQPVLDNKICKSLNESMAVCDLFASNKGSRTFSVTGDALATSDGSKKGRMQLLMISVDDKTTCNSGSSKEVMVDNATRLSGPEYSCQITVPAGKIRRIMLIAPNSRADATHTIANATF